MPSPINAAPKLLRSRDAAEMLGTTEARLRNLRNLRRGPAFIKVGRSVRYRPEDIAAFIEANRQTTLETPGEGEGEAAP